jgi:hypothetical protein
VPARLEKTVGFASLLADECRQADVGSRQGCKYGHNREAHDPGLCWYNNSVVIVGV